MSTQIIEHAPQARCYQCGEPQIVAVCHHCGRPMCANHGPAVLDVTRTESIEFSDLGLKDAQCGERAVHCKECDHIVRSPSVALMVLGVLFALMSSGGLVLFLGTAILARRVDTVIRLLLLTPGIIMTFVLLGSLGLVFLGYKLRQKQIAKIRESRPPLPLLPRFDPIRVTEYLKGSITVDDAAHYHASVNEVEGEATIVANLAKPEREGLQTYRKKYTLTEDEDVPFHAGFAVLQGPAGLKFDDEVSKKQGSPLIIPLTGRVSEQPFLSGVKGRGTGEWRIHRKYKPTVSTTTSVPIRLVPSFVQESAQRAIDLELQWIVSKQAQEMPLIQRIESLELQVPITWGEVEVVEPSALIGKANISEGETVRTITWQRLSLSQSAESGVHRHTFFVRFENSIEPANTIRGRAQVVFKGTLSGLQGIDLYYPLGRRREQEEPILETVVKVDFELSLAGLRYQDTRVIPDPKRERDKGKPETSTFEGVIPDHTTIMALTNAMSDQDFYVKRVIENPPRTGERANLVNRYWDIAGRRYLGVYPIDYHLVVTGEEVYGGGIRAQAGMTKTTLTVQGTYANPDMEAQIENVWEQLNHSIGSTLQQLPRALPLPTQPGAQAEPEPLARPALEATLDNAQRVQILRRRLDQLTDALLAGRLSEKTFLELKASIEQEIRSLESQG